MRDSHQDFADRVNSRLGTVMLACASLMSVLIFADRTETQFIPLPGIWQATRDLHMFLCVAMFFAAAVLLKSSSQLDQRRQPSGPVFASVKFFNRENCSLCDRALESLRQFQPWLPVIDVIDVDDDEQLKRMFGESVPVVEIDGRVRFRGGVHPLLLQRLIDGAEAQAGLNDSESFDSQNAVKPDRSHSNETGQTG